MHRDVAATYLSREVQPAERLTDGTLVVEQPRFDGVAGRVKTTWYWYGAARQRTEERVDPHVLHHRARRADAARRARAGLGAPRLLAAPFKSEGPDLGGRVGLLARPI